MSLDQWMQPVLSRVEEYQPEDKFDGGCRALLHKRYDRLSQYFTKRKWRIALIDQEDEINELNKKI